MLRLRQFRGLGSVVARGLVQRGDFSCVRPAKYITRAVAQRVAAILFVALAAGLDLPLRVTASFSRRNCSMLSQQA